MSDTHLVPATLADLTAALDPLLPVFVLIDPMLGEPVPAEYARDDWQRDIFPIALHESVALDAHQHPYLIALAGLDDSLLETTLKIAHTEQSAFLDAGLGANGGAVLRIGGWLQSSMHPEALAEQLSSMFRVRTATYTSATYLRLLDRRVLSLLRDVAGDARVAAQFGRLHSWTYLNCMSTLSTLHSAGETALPLTLRSGEWEQMSDGETLHRTIRQWLGAMGESALPAGLDERALFARARGALEHAAQMGARWPHRFRELQDFTTWAALSMRYPEVTNNDKVNAWLQQTGTADEPAEPLMHAFADIIAILHDQRLVA